MFFGRVDFPWQGFDAEIDEAVIGFQGIHRIGLRIGILRCSLGNGLFQKML
jgi:hypothetical protein